MHNRALCAQLIDSALEKLRTDVGNSMCICYSSIESIPQPQCAHPCGIYLHNTELRQIHALICSKLLHKPTSSCLH